MCGGPAKEVTTSSSRTIVYTCVDPGIQKHTGIRPLGAAVHQSSKVMYRPCSNNTDAFVQQQHAIQRTYLLG